MMPLRAGGCHTRGGRGGWTACGWARKGERRRAAGKAATGTRSAGGGRGYGSGGVAARASSSAGGERGALKGHAGTVQRPRGAGPPPPQTLLPAGRAPHARRQGLESPPPSSVARRHGFAGPARWPNLRAMEERHCTVRASSRHGKDGIRPVADSVASPHTWRGRAAAVGVPSKPGRSGGGAGARRALWAVVGRDVATLPVGGRPRGATSARRCAVRAWPDARVDTLLTLANPPFTAVLAQMDDGGTVLSGCPTVQRGARDRRALVSRSCCGREEGKRGTCVPRPQPRGRGETRA